MININDALQELNVLNSKKSKNSIDKLINLIRTNQKTNKFFNSETVFALSVLPAISTQIMFKKIIESFIETFKIMHFNNVRTIIVDEIQRIVNVTLYRQLLRSCSQLNQSRKLYFIGASALTVLFIYLRQLLLYLLLMLLVLVNLHSYDLLYAGP